VGAGSIALAAVVGAVILAVVLYGLNSPIPNTLHAGTPTTASSAPAAGGNDAPAAPCGQDTGNTGHS
jgi:hypothetical protein